MKNKVTVAVDAMGGDNAPDEIIKGALSSLEIDRIHLILVGKEEIINGILNEQIYDKNRVKVVNATEVVEGADIPSVAIKQKKDSSMVVGLKLVRNKEADAFVSAGNSGALLTGATMIVGRIHGIERPALATLLPAEKGFCMLIDSGANVDVKASYLVQFAKIGSVYMEDVLKIKAPKVALLNVGTEKEKGNILTKEAYSLLENAGLNFIGNMEGRDIPFNYADVIVCDAFVGNAVLKFSEGLSKLIMDVIKEELKSSPISALGAVFSLGAFKKIKKRFDYNEVGGAPFLGLKSLVIKAHGSSNAKTIYSSIMQCLSFCDNDAVQKIEAKIQNDNSI